MNDALKKDQLRAAIARLKVHHTSGMEASKHLSRKKFQQAADRLRKRILDDFKREEWPRFQMLDEIFQKGHGLPVATLSVCGVGTAELRFTKLLAYFFDSHNPHGLGGTLVRAVFACEPGIDNDLPFDTCRAKAEVPIGPSLMSNNQAIDNSLDILITVGDFRILVEQKICSAEGREQTHRYTAAMQNYFKSDRTACFFLTPDEKSASNALWHSLSHRTLFCRIASVLDRHALSSVARHNLRALLWDLMIGPLAQREDWLAGLRDQTQKVAKDVNRFADLNQWFARYGLFSGERRTLLKIVEG